ADDTDEPADQRQRATFEQQQPSHLPRREAEREQRADFRRALFDAELKQQRHQQQRGGDEEEAEAEKQLAEILRLFGGCERLLPYRLEAQADRSRVKRRDKFFFKFRPGLLDGIYNHGSGGRFFRWRRRRRDWLGVGREFNRHCRAQTAKEQVRGEPIPHRSQVAESVSPQRLSGGESYERLRRAAIILPVILVFGRDAFELDRQTGVPV